jgi:hypothetical protein
MTQFTMDSYKDLDFDTIEKKLEEVSKANQNKSST